MNLVQQVNTAVQVKSATNSRGFINKIAFHRKVVKMKKLLLLPIRKRKGKIILIKNPTIYNSDKLSSAKFTTDTLPHSNS